MLATLTILPGTTGALTDVTTVRIHFEIPSVTIIPAVASFRGSCDLWATGENLTLLAAEATRTSLETSPAECTMVLTILGLDVAIPTIATTPLGRSSLAFPIPLADVSVDLLTSLASTTRISTPSVATVEPENLTWTAWGARTLTVAGSPGEGGRVETTMNSTFTYSVSLGLTIAFFGAPLVQANLTSLGSYLGTPSLETSLVVDLVPRALQLVGVEAITHEAATVTWSGVVDADVIRLELLVEGGGWNVTYRIEDPSSASLRISVIPETAYVVRIVVVDEAGQRSTSSALAFTSLEAPEVPPTDGETDGTVSGRQVDAMIGVLVALAALAAVVGYGIGFLRGRRSE